MVENAGEFLVNGGNAFAPVDQEKNQVGGLDGDICLRSYLVRKAIDEIGTMPPVSMTSKGCLPTVQMVEMRSRVTPGWS